MRAHLYKAITDTSGNVQLNTVVRVLQPNATPPDVTLLSDTVYADFGDDTVLGTSFTVANGVVDFWLDNPQYVMLGLTPPGQLEYFIDNVVVDSPFSEVDVALIPTGISQASLEIGAANANMRVDLNTDPSNAIYAWGIADKYRATGWLTCPSGGGVLLVPPGVYSYSARASGVFAGSTKPPAVNWYDNSPLTGGIVPLIGNVDSGGNFAMTISVPPRPVSTGLILGLTFGSGVTDPGFTGVIAIDVVNWGADAAVTAPF
jgi:hypothetical protein